MSIRLNLLNNDFEDPRLSKRHADDLMESLVGASQLLLKDPLALGMAIRSNMRVCPEFTFWASPLKQFRPTRASNAVDLRKTQFPQCAVACQG